VPGVGATVLTGASVTSKGFTAPRLTTGAHTEPSECCDVRQRPGAQQLSNAEQ